MPTTPSRPAMMGRFRPTRHAAGPRMPLAVTSTPARASAAPAPSLLLQLLPSPGAPPRVRGPSRVQVLVLPADSMLHTTYRTQGRDTRGHSCAYTETRGSLNCDLLRQWLNPPSSASCLRFDPLYFQVHQPPTPLPHSTAACRTAQQHTAPKRCMALLAHGSHPTGALAASAIVKHVQECGAIA